ncbi:MAG: S24 family peptidase [Bacteroidota bacterium]
MSNIITKRFIKCHHALKENKVIRSSRQFAMSLDYLPQSLSEILKERRDVTVEVLRKAVERYKISPVYLFTGTGPMFMEENYQDDLKVLTIVTNELADEQIIHVPVPAQAGYPKGINNPNYIQDLPTFSLPDYKYQEGTHRSFAVCGDSMQPILCEGDKVICSHLEARLWAHAIKDNYVYVLVTNSDVIVKRVYNHIKVDQQLMLHSDNESYPPYAIPISEVREIWLVRARISPFLPTTHQAKNRMQHTLNELKVTIEQQSALIKQLLDQ